MKNTYWLFFLFVGFISIQPIIDMLTTYMVLNMDSGLSIGVVIRFLYMIFAGVLLLVFAKQSKWARYSIIYLIAFAYKINGIVHITVNIVFHGFVAVGLGRITPVHDVYIQSFR